MVLSCTLLSNSVSAEYISDSEKIMDFMGNAFKFTDSETAEIKRVINEKMSGLGLIYDAEAVSNSRKNETNFTDDDILLEIKGNVLSSLYKVAADEKCSWLKYDSYSIYQPNASFSKILHLSSTGDLITTREAGILYAVGIGCKKSLEKAAYRLMQSSMWGDIPSMYLLSYVYSLMGDKINSDIFKELTCLCENYLLEGRTVLTEEMKNGYSEDACNYYVYISSIMQDIRNVLNVRKINFSFIEALLENSLSHKEKLALINNYDKMTWKEITNSSTVSFKFGF